jgi:hypothetical protein
MRNSQLASVARTLGESTQRAAVRPKLVRMEVSKQEERLIEVKRRSLARLRVVLKRDK